MGTSCWKNIQWSTLLLSFVLFTTVQSLPVGSEEKQIVIMLNVSSITEWIEKYARFSYIGCNWCEW